MGWNCSAQIFRRPETTSPSGLRCFRLLRMFLSSPAQLSAQSCLIVVSMFSSVDF